MAIGDEFYRKLKEGNPFEEIIDEQDIPLAPGVSYEDIEAPLSEDASAQIEAQNMADAVANDIVATENVPVQEREQREDLQEAVMKPGVVESGEVNQEEFDRIKGNATPQEALMQEIRLARETRDKKLEEGQTRDRYTNLLNALNEGFSKMDAGTAMKASRTPNMKALESMKLAPDNQERELKIGESRIDNLLKEYNLLNRGELSERDRAYLNIQKQGMEKADERSRLNRELRIEAQKEREDKEISMQRSRVLNQARGLLKDDPRYKKSLEQAMEFEGVEALIPEVRKGNQAALAALGTKLARAMGEVGVLTDTDVVRYLGQKSWGRKLKSWYEGGAKGKLPEESLQELQNNLGEFSKILDRNVSSVYSNAGSRLKTAFPKLGNKEVQGLLGRIQPTISQTVTDKVEVVLPNGQKGKIDKNKIEAFKKKYPDAQVME